MPIIANLPDKIYLSFDIDGLDPKLCPNTGTPVAGGFETEQVLYLIQLIIESGKKIIGFDLNEVAPGKDEWNGNVSRSASQGADCTSLQSQRQGAWRWPARRDSNPRPPA